MTPLTPAQLEAILRHLGIRYQDRGAYYLFRSPFRVDKDPSMVVYKDTGAAIDYAGEFRGSILKFFYKITKQLVKDAMPDLGLSEDADEVSWGYTPPRETPEEARPARRHGVVISEAAIVSVFDEAEAYRYCLERRLDERMIEEWDIKFARRCRIVGVEDPRPDLPATLFSRCLLIPIIVDGETWSVEGRSIVPKEERPTGDDKKKFKKVLYPRGCSVDTLFQPERLDRRSPLVVVEGLMDLPTVRRVWPNSTSTFGIQVGPNQRRQLNEFDRVILLGDPDEGGARFVGIMADLLERELWVADRLRDDPKRVSPEEVLAAIEGARPQAERRIDEVGLFASGPEDDLSW